MNVEVVSKTAQRFNNRTYYKCGPYYQRKGSRLHRDVWIYHNGPIPAGYHVHHKDSNRENNDISNLALLNRHDHLSGHMQTEERKIMCRESIDHAREYASKWHGSPEGLAYHSALGKANWEKRETQTYTCTECSKEFSTKHIYSKGRNHFCHPNCKARYNYRKRRKESQNSAYQSN